MLKQSLNNIKKQLDTNFSYGLSDEQVSKRLEKYGKNVLQSQKSKSFIWKFFAQFAELMSIILLFASIISFGIHIYEGTDLYEPFIILGIVIANALLGAIQQKKAEKALNSLIKLTGKTAKVFRNGDLSVIQTTNIVPGDILIFEDGDIIPCDCRIIESNNLQVDESTLTGESNPVFKKECTLSNDTPLAERINTLLSGTTIRYGNAKAVAIATGMETELGKIAKLLVKTKRKKTPLQQKIATVAKYISIMAIASCIVVIIFGTFIGIPFDQILLISISLAVAAIPESLPAIITVILAIGVERMSKLNAIIKELPAVETFGSASIICTDKTGTLTLNKMNVVDVYSYHTSSLCSSIGNEEAQKIIHLGALCCTASSKVGDPTEIAIIRAKKSPKLYNEYTKLFVVPFDSERKRMSIVYKSDTDYLVVVKGAFESLNEIGALDYSKDNIIANDLANQAKRVIAVGHKILKNLPNEITAQSIERSIELDGIIAMIDPPRAEVKESIRICKDAGIKSIMITGDNMLTAISIAKNLGIYTDSDVSITGNELKKLSQKELISIIPTITVYARTTPEDKIRIVKAWKSLGEVVAMTGDGVNDAPALENADIGCAMGRSGSDVAKSSSDVIITDDNFSTIIHAVEEGRNIYSNIKNVIAFLLGTNFCEIVTVLLGLAIFTTSPFLSLQLLWLNLVTDSFPAIGLGLQKQHTDTMKQTPRPRTESIISKHLLLQIIIFGILFSGISILAYYIGYSTSGTVEMARTMAFITLSLCLIIHSFNLCTKHSLLKINIFKFKQLILLNLMALFMLGVVIFIEPIATVFGLSLLTFDYYLLCVALSLPTIVAMEMLKLSKLN